MYFYKDVYIIKYILCTQMLTKLKYTFCLQKKPNKKSHNNTVFIFRYLEQETGTSGELTSPVKLLTAAFPTLISSNKEFVFFLFFSFSAITTQIANSKQHFF